MGDAEKVAGIFKLFSVGARVRIVQALNTTAQCRLKKLECVCR